MKTLFTLILSALNPLSPTKSQSFDKQVEDYRRKHKLYVAEPQIKIRSTAYPDGTKVIQFNT